MWVLVFGAGVLQVLGVGLVRSVGEDQCKLGRARERLRGPEHTWLVSNKCWGVGLFECSSGYRHGRARERGYTGSSRSLYLQVLGCGSGS